MGIDRIRNGSIGIAARLHGDDAVRDFRGRTIAFVFGFGMAIFGRDTLDAQRMAQQFPKPGEIMARPPKLNWTKSREQYTGRSNGKLHHFRHRQGRAETQFASFEKHELPNR